MYFDSLGALMSMDGHGVYVWTAYAFAIGIIAFLVISPQRRQSKFLQQLSGEARRQARAEGGLPPERKI